jgi:hypothetical protein
LQSHPFGTERDVYEPGYYWLAHSMYPKQELSEIPRVKFGGAKCSQPYEISIFSISAMLTAAGLDHCKAHFHPGSGMLCEFLNKPLIYVPENSPFIAEKR